MIGCCGGGSNYAGLALPFVRDRLEGKEIEFYAVEPTACPTLTKGEYTYDFGDTAGLTPLLKMYTLGHDFIPPSIHAGGLRYHGEAPIISALKHDGIMKALAYHQLECFDAGALFTRVEGIVPAPETSHAIKAVIDLALECKKKGEEKVILFNFSGHGLLDLGSYELYLEGKLKDVDE